MFLLICVCILACVLVSMCVCCLNVKTLSAVFVFECVLVGQAMVGPRGHYLTVLGAPPYYTSWENCSKLVICLPYLGQKKFLYLRFELSHYQLAKIELLMKAGSLNKNIVC